MYTEVSIPLPILPEGWAAEKDFKAIGSLSAATQRSIEPVGPHFLAHARRARHKRTFSEDDRIQAQENVKKVEEDDSGEISEPEDPMMLSRDAKDWKVSSTYCLKYTLTDRPREPRSLCRSGSLKASIQSHRRANQACSPQEGSSSPSR
jgi:DnaJ family protein C protein 2